MSNASFKSGQWIRFNFKRMEPEINTSHAGNRNIGEGKIVTRTYKGCEKIICKGSRQDVLVVHKKKHLWVPRAGITEVLDGERDALLPEEQCP